MQVIDLNTSSSLVEAVRLVKAESYRLQERVIAEFNDFILDSNKSDEDNIKDYKAQWNKSYIDGIDWEQRRYEIAKEILPSVLETSFGVRTEVEDKNLVVSYAIEWADALIDKLKTRRINDE